MWDRAITTERLNARPGEIRPLLLADSDALLRSGGPPEPVAEWAAAFPEHRPSARPRRQDRSLDRGLRQVLRYRKRGWPDQLTMGSQAREASGEKLCAGCDTSY